MATITESNPCSICTKPSAKFVCTGCKAYFCSKHFKEHEQQLSKIFDDDIMRSHDELFDRIQKLEKSDHLSPDLYARIEQWRKTTIEKVDRAAEKAHRQLTELLNKQKIVIAERLQAITKEIHSRRDEDDFVENDIDRLRKKISEVQQAWKDVIQKDKNETVIIKDDHIDWDKLIHIQEDQRSSSFLPMLNLNANAKWKQNGITVAGGHDYGSEMSQLYHPWGLFVDEDQTIYIAEYSNHRVTEWKCDATHGQVVAGGNGQGASQDQLNYPTDVIIDKIRDNLIICDYNNKRVVCWPRQDHTSGEIIINNVGCVGLTMDDSGFLYVVDHDEHAVKRYRIGESQATVVAGGNGRGDRLDQLYYPRYIFVDKEHSVYVSEFDNHRVVKWTHGAKQGIIVAGGHGQGHDLTQLSNPYGIVVDQAGIIYVADYANNRVMRWTQGATEGTIVVGGNGHGSQANQLHGPIGLSFDQQGNLYVSDNGNHRIQKFYID